MKLQKREKGNNFLTYFCFSCILHLRYAITAIFLGLGGSVAAASLFFPQVWASYKSKKTNELAWTGILIGMVNGVFWTSYGLLKGDPFIYVTNTILFVGAFLLALLKKRYG